MRVKQIAICFVLLAILFTLGLFVKYIEDETVESAKNCYNDNRFAFPV